MKKLLVFMGIIALILPLMFLGCSDGDDGAAGAPGMDGQDATAAVNPESCSVCHNGTAEADGAAHQASYDELFQDGPTNGMVITNLAYANDNVSDTVTFSMTKAGVDFPCTGLSPAAGDSLGIYFVEYTGTSFQNDNAIRLSLGTAGNASGSTPSTLSYAADVCTSTVPQSFLDNLATLDGLIVVYGRNERVGSLPPSRVVQPKYPFAGLLETGAGVAYASAANNAGCVKCHTDPYLKHGYIYGQVDGDAANDFYTCKACHQDNGEGGHFEWQLAVNDPPRWAAIAALVEANDSEFGEEMTPAELLQYAYRTTLMNDVHMSHAMEFPYPQSMANCATCHEGKLADTLTDANFVLETCKSCHPVTGGTDTGKVNEDGEIEFAYDFRPIALETIIPHDWTEATVCNSCHAVAGIAPVFSAIHTGYDKAIYGAADQKYSDFITASVDNASFDPATNQLTISFSAAGSLGAADSADIVPTVLVGLYGWDTKDYIVGPHERDADRNRLLEFAVDGVTVNPRFTVVSAAAGSWEVIADLSMWADMIAADNVTRVEIGVMPRLFAVVGTDNVQVALNAPSRTFDLVANDFDDAFFSPIVKVATGCNNCHDALATTFHSPDRGGNIVVCRLCHITKSGGSHLEMQSRSIDSYVHAIHSFQAFDPGDVDFTDPVEALHYKDHTELFPYPTHDITNCMSCHNAGAFNVPDQSKSLPGIFSASDSPLDGWARNIGVVPSYIAGPASRACGSCHRAVMINEDAAGELASFNSHTRTFGYLVEADANNQDSQDNLMAIIDQIFSSL